MEEILNRLKNIEAMLYTTKMVFNVEEVSKFLGMEEGTIYNMCSKKLIPHYKKGKYNFFDRIEIENWLKEKKISTKEDINRLAANYSFLNR